MPSFKLKSSLVTILQGVEFSIFQLMGLTTVQRYCAACDILYFFVYRFRDYNDLLVENLRFFRFPTQSRLKPSPGVFPQGSVLGHLLFLLCINDTFDLFTGSVSVKLFADDIKIYMEVNGMSQITDLQEYIDDIAAWARTWQVKLSVNKCQHMLITLRKSVGRSS